MRDRPNLLACVYKNNLEEDGDLDEVEGVAVQERWMLAVKTRGGATAKAKNVCRTVVVDSGAAAIACGVHDFQAELMQISEGQRQHLQDAQGGDLRHHGRGAPGCCLAGQPKSTSR